MFVPHKLYYLLHTFLIRLLFALSLYLIHEEKTKRLNTPPYFFYLCVLSIRNTTKRLNSLPLLCICFLSIRKNTKRLNTPAYSLYLCVLSKRKETKRLNTPSYFIVRSIPHGTIGNKLPNCF